MVHIFDLKATGYLNHNKLCVAESKHTAKKKACGNSPLSKFAPIPRAYLLDKYDLSKLYRFTNSKVFQTRVG